MEKTQQRILFGVSIGHAAHDTWFGVAPVLLAAMSDQLSLSIADIGFMLLLYQGISSLTQPFFGRLAEKIGARPLAVGSILWTTLVYSVALFAQSQWLIATCIALAGFGSGAWHPQGSANATVAGGKRWGATAASVFFLGGTLGTAFLGAALGGYLLDAFGRTSLLLISGITVVLALTVVRTSVPQQLSVAKETATNTTKSTAGRAFWTLLIILLVGIALRSLSYNSLNTYVPRLLEDQEVAPRIYGAVMAAFLTTIAVGGVLGSYLADRLGLAQMLIISIVLSALALFGFVQTTGLLSYVLFALSGLLMGPSHTLFLVAGQRQFPQRMAMVSGIFLGFTFVSGAGGAWILGLIADRIGLAPVISILPWALLGAAVAGLIAVPRQSRETAIKQEPAASS
jgi:FSR family fosmidomycin resistance protein-like MFS transporter